MSTQQLPSATSRLFPKRFVRWQAAGLSARAARVVSLASCDSVEEISRLGRAYFEGRPNCAAKTLAELAALAGWPPKTRTPVDAIAAALTLAMDADEAREAAADVMSALRKSGFILTVRRSRA
jgi:hypothetical protein